MRTAILAILAATLSCGPEALTCELLQDPSNCWASVAAQVAACLPDSSETGTLSSDRTSCTFADGTRVVFDTPLPQDSADLTSFGFRVETDSTCATVLDTFENRIELESGGDSATAELEPGGDFHLRCGDGSDYQADFDLLFTCTPGAGPTDGFDVSPDLVTFSIISVATPGELFRCAP